MQKFRWLWNRQPLSGRVTRQITPMLCTDKNCTKKSQTNFWWQKIKIHSTSLNCTTPESQPIVTLAVPFIGTPFPALRSIAHKYGIRLIPKFSRTINIEISTHKNRLPSSQLNSVVYIIIRNCGKIYIGKTTENWQRASMNARKSGRMLQHQLLVRLERPLSTIHRFITFRSLIMSKLSVMKILTVCGKIKEAFCIAATGEKALLMTT